MNYYFNRYAEVSGASEQHVSQLNALVAKLPKLSDKSEEASLQVKWFLRGENGFDYDSRNFTLQDMLRTKSGNCLGLPILAGCLLGYREFQPRFRVLVRPLDKISALEGIKFESLKQELRFDNPRFAENQEDSPMYRFEPLEHLVYSADGKSFYEATSEDIDHATEAESVRDLSFEQALSYINKDKAVRIWQAGLTERAKDEALKGLTLWKDNRQLHYLLSGIYQELGDKESGRGHAKEFERIDGNDSQYFLNRYMLKGRQEDLEEAIRRYPSYAMAIAMKAKSLIGKDNAESKWLFALASHCFANSQNLRLEDFNKAFRKEINKTKV